jgi:hypothetical protein
MPRPITRVDNAALYEAALEGLELQKQRIEEQIRQVRALVGGRKPRPYTVASPVAETSEDDAKPRKKRNLSAAARKRIAAAQKKRWAEFRKQQGS